MSLASLVLMTFRGRGVMLLPSQSLCLVLDGMILLLKWVLEKEVRMLATVYLVLVFAYEMSPQRTYLYIESLVPSQCC